MAHRELLSLLSKLLDEARTAKPRLYRKGEKSIQRIINMLMRSK